MSLRDFSFISHLPGECDTGNALHCAERHRQLWVCDQPCVTVCGIPATAFLTIHNQHATLGLLLAVLMYLSSTLIYMISGEKI